MEDKTARADFLRRVNGELSHEFQFGKLSIRRATGQVQNWSYTDAQRAKHYSTWKKGLYLNNCAIDVTVSHMLCEEADG